MNEIQAGRSALLAPVRYEEFDLSVARDRQILGITANTFYVDPGADNSAYRGATATLWIDDSPLTVGPGFLLRKQSSNIRLSNSTQSGKRLRLVYGQDVAVTSWFTSSGISLNQPSSILPEGQNQFRVASDVNVSSNLWTFTAGDNQAIYLLHGQARSHGAQKFTQAQYSAKWGAFSQSQQDELRMMMEPQFTVTSTAAFNPLVKISHEQAQYMIHQDLVAPNDVYVHAEFNVRLEPQVWRSVAGHNRTVAIYPGITFTGSNLFYQAQAAYQLFSYP